MDNHLIPADNCTLAFAFRGGDTVITKLPVGQVKPGNRVDLVEGGDILIVETVDLIDGGPAYRLFAKAYPIYTANSVLEYTWRRCNHDS